MKINAMNRLILRTQQPDASEHARQYPNSGLSAADITGQDPLEQQYAMFVADGNPAGPLSMVPLMWPDPVHADLEPAPEPMDWQQELPAQTHPLEPFILHLVYGAIPDMFATIQELEQMPDAAWSFLKQRWDVIRRHHRAYIREHPACIPDRMERQRCLSRLWVAAPIVLVAAEYGRIRARIDPDGTTPDGREDRKGKRKKQQETRTVLQQKEQGGALPARPAAAQSRHPPPVGWAESGAAPYRSAPVQRAGQICSVKMWPWRTFSRGQRPARSGAAGRRLR